MRLRLLLLLCAACASPAPSGDAPAEPPQEPPVAEEPAAPPAPPLPAGFKVEGEPVVEEAYLGPADTWRQIRSRLTTLQADARRAGKDVLVSFEPDAIHVTRLDGSRTTWRLPDGLALTVEIAHVLVRADLTLEGFDRDGTQVPSEEELTIAIVTLTEGETATREFRLVIKGGAAFRSMSSG